MVRRYLPWLRSGTSLLLPYAQSLRSISENDKANQIMEKFDQISGNDSRGNFCQNENYMDAIKANSGRYKIEDAGINSPYSDYGTTIYANKIVFASARDTGLRSQKTYLDRSTFTKLYVADVRRNEFRKSS
jgi:hypothetical protein